MIHSFHFETSSGPEDPIGAAEMRQLRQEFSEEGVCAVVQMFKEEGDLLLEQLAHASQRHDARGLRRAAHALRGASANFGAKPLEALCDQIEDSAGSGNLAEAAGLVDQVRAEADRVAAALQRECIEH